MVDENCPVKTVSFKDLIEKKDVSVTGFGTYLIGLSTKGDVAIETTDDDLCMVLLTLTLHENGGCTLSPANMDLVCYINSSEDPLSGETHLIDGTKLEVADKKLMFIDGPIPKRRRKLPPTPGLAIGGPPAKPTRKSSTSSAGESTSGDATKEIKSDVNDTVSKDDDEVEEENNDKRWLETSWCMLDLGDSEQNLFRNLHTPEQISILSASYFAKQLRMFTDATITQQLLDDIFKLFMDTIDDCKDIYMNYLSDTSKALAKVPDRSNSQPMHGPAVKLLTELLKQCIDPVERVILMLDLLRTFSHFDNNIATMVRHQTTAAVLGSISAYLDVVEVQQYGIDILAKMVTYKPSLNKKAPVREVGLDLVLRSIKYHDMNLSLARSACRVLANLASTLINVLNNWLDTEDPADDNIASMIEQYEGLLEYVFKEGIPAIQTIMKNFGSDLGVNTEGRKFIFYYAKLPQLQLKKSKWSKSIDQQNLAVEQETEESKQKRTDGEEEDDEEEEEDLNGNTDTISKNEFLTGEVKEQEPQGILKRVGSYENLRTSDKRLIFADDTVGGSDSETTNTSGSENEIEQSFTRSLSMPAKFEEEFSAQVVQHLVRKTIKRRRQDVIDDEDDFDADNSDSESEGEFLQSLSVIQKFDESNSLSNPSVSDNVIEQNSGTLMQTNEEIENSESKNTNKTDIDETFHENSKVDTDMIEKRDIENSIVNSIQNTHIGQKDSTNVQNGDRNQDIKKVECQSGTDAIMEDAIERSAVIDVTFLGKLVRTQIVVHVGSLVFRGEDSMVLMVIDKPINILLEDASAPQVLVDFAAKQYGAKMTLMDLEPAIVISVIDAVRYRSVTKDLVQSAVLNLTRTMNEKLQTPTINTTMMFFKSMFSDEHLRPVLTDEDFLKDFRPCFLKATERMEKSHSMEELRKNLAS